MQNELLAIQKLRKETTRLARDLFDAARDQQTFESITDSIAPVCFY
jgi:hypothetical protein